MSCGYCMTIYCMLMSIWGIVQLYLMALCYYLEAVPLVHDAIEHHEHTEEKITYRDFIKKTKENYRELMFKCVAGGTFYVILLIVCILSLWRIKKKEARQRLLESDIDYICNTMKSKREEEVLSKEDRKRRDRELKEFQKSMRPAKQKEKGKKQKVPKIDEEFEENSEGEIVKVVKVKKVIPKEEKPKEVKPKEEKPKPEKPKPKPKEEKKKGK